MRGVFVVGLMLLAFGGAQAQERAFGVGHARPGMRLMEFRFQPHAAGQKVFCSNDPGLPPGTSKLEMPKNWAKAKVNRCSLFVEKQGFWQQAEVAVAGNPAEFWLMAIEDEGGTERVAQVYATQPRPSFEKTLDAFIRGIGQPGESRPGSAKWKTPAVEATVQHDGYEVKIFAAEPKLQALLQQRLEAAGKKK